jgi:tRNA modification GTPase
VRRSEATVADAHLVLLVLDAYERWTPADMRVWQKVQSKKIVAVWNKIDLLCAGDGHPQMPVEHPARQVWVSAKTGEGIDSLKQAVFQQGIPEDLADDDLIVTSLRHENCLQRSIESMAAARNALAAGLSEEFAVTDLRHALQALGEITGETVVEDILQRIFSDFCIGK